ncbi:MAG TPA: glycosyltransferase family 4 protein [Planctomycetaceae bacterium]|jgi:glycosyltransferase involved in cell wall biosynthesis|nr:glycosyltransferase family 4 protein [Planctomycetaceae bacterium]
MQECRQESDLGTANATTAIVGVPSGRAGRPRILYALGPGHVVDAYRKWSAGLDYTTETSVTFSSQFFDFCRAHGAEAWAVSSHPAREVFRDGAFTVENRPKRFADPRGLLFHWNQFLYGLSIMWSALRYRADVLIVDSGTTHWFVLSLLSLSRIRVVASLHNSYWASGFLPGGAIKRLIRTLDGQFWRHTADATLCVSPECQRQVERLAGGRNRPVFQYRCQFRPADFASVLPPPAHDVRPFRAIFAGRVERNKGVFDLLDMAAAFKRESPGRLQIEICGGGEALEELKRAIAERGLADDVVIHGKLNRPDLLAVYGRSHVVIVPTRSTFCEGMPMVAAEAILSGRPVLTSRLSNALDVLNPALVEAQPDDPASYVAGLRRLMTDRASYEECCRACPTVGRQFYDRDQSLTAAIERMIHSLDLTAAAARAPG